MARIKHELACYPETFEEFHVVTPTGKIVYITNDIERANAHTGIKAFGFKLLRVITHKEEISLSPLPLNEGQSNECPITDCSSAERPSA